MEQQPPSFSWKKIMVICVVVVVFIGLLLYSLIGDAFFYQALFHVKRTLANGERLRTWILAAGPLAPIMFVILQMLQVVFAPVPGEATGIIGGYLFGAWPGFFLSSVALTAGSGLAFSIGHLFSGIIKKKYETTKVYRTFNHLIYKGDFVIPFVLFLLPGFPKDILSYLLGTSFMPFKVFLFIAGVARMPGTLMLSFQGAHVYQEEYHKLFFLIVVSIAISLPCYLYRKKILTFLNQYNSSSPAKDDEEKNEVLK
jgi:uncharacterized membrane protein YdjX (TVP38/TMEM64 family)